MTKTASLILAGLALGVSAPFAQDWGSDYNMGSIGVSGGNDRTGSLIIDCAEAGNGVVPQGSLSVFVKPAADSASPKGLGVVTLSIDGTEVALPVDDDAGDGLVYTKTPETLEAARQLIDLLNTGEELVVIAAGAEIARIDLAGAGAALEGVEACLAP